MYVCALSARARTTQRQPQSFPMQYSTIATNVNLYNTGHENPVIVVTETDSAHAHNVPTGLGGSLYVWNVDKYISGTGPALCKMDHRELRDGNGEL